MQICFYGNQPNNPTAIDINQLKIGLVEKNHYFFYQYLIVVTDDAESVTCHRTNGIISIPKKIPRKISLPGLTLTNDKKVKFSRKLSCPTLQRAKESQIFCEIENVQDFIDCEEVKPKYVAQPQAALVPKVW